MWVTRNAADGARTGTHPATHQAYGYELHSCHTLYGADLTLIAPWLRRCLRRRSSRPPFHPPHEQGWRRRHDVSRRSRGHFRPAPRALKPLKAAGRSQGRHLHWPWREKPAREICTTTRASRNSDRSSLAGPRAAASRVVERFARVILTSDWSHAGGRSGRGGQP